MSGRDGSPRNTRLRPDVTTARQARKDATRQENVFPRITRIDADWWLASDILSCRAVLSEISVSIRVIRGPQKKSIPSLGVSHSWDCSSSSRPPCPPPALSASRPPLPDIPALLFCLIILTLIILPSFPGTALAAASILSTYSARHCVSSPLHKPPPRRFQFFSCICGWNFVHCNYSDEKNMPITAKK